MSADYISVGFTRDISHVSEDEAFAIIEEYVKEVAEYFRDWDDMDLLDQHIEDDSEEEILRATRQIMHEGVSSIYNLDGESYDFGDKGRTFTTKGNMTWGDDPFEGFSEVCAVLNIVTQWKSLGHRIGIIGWGIVLD